MLDSGGGVHVYNPPPQARSRDYLYTTLLIGDAALAPPLRRDQLVARRKAQSAQPVLFELREDCRPVSERTATRRCSDPSLLDWPASRPA